MDTYETPLGRIPKINSRTTLDELLSAVADEESPPQLPEPSDPASSNPAVARCCQAYARALEEATDQGESEFTAASDAARAYRQTMPPLSGHQHISDFIACVANGARLLYAAQVAHTSLLGELQRATINQSQSAI